MKMFIALSVIVCSILNFTQLLPVSYYGNNAEFVGTVAELYKVYRVWTVCTSMARRLIFESVCYTVREEELKQTEGGGT